MPRIQLILLHIGIPLIVGMVMGVNRVRIGEHLTLQGSVIFWVVTSFGIWAIFEIVTWGCAKILRPWNPPFFLVMLAGMTLASVIARIFLYYCVDFVEPYRIDASTSALPPPIGLTRDFLSYHFVSWSGFFILWFAFNCGLLYLAGIERFGYRKGKALISTSDVQDAVIETDRDPPRPAIPHFVSRLPAYLQTDLLAISVDDHYLNVVTARGRGTVHYTLAEAVAELEECGIEGFRIHRSHWVAKKALRSVKSDGRGYVVIVSDNLSLPVGPTYIGLLKAEGAIS